MLFISVSVMAEIIDLVERIRRKFKMRIFVQSKKIKVKILFAGLLVSAFLTGCKAEEENRKNDRKEKKYERKKLLG